MLDLKSVARNVAELREPLVCRENDPQRNLLVLASYHLLTAAKLIERAAEARIAAAERPAK